MFDEKAYTIRNLSTRDENFRCKRRHFRRYPWTTTNERSSSFGHDKNFVSIFHIWKTTTEVRLLLLLRSWFKVILMTPNSVTIWGWNLFPSHIRDGSLISITVFGYGHRVWQRNTHCCFRHHLFFFPLQKFILFFFIPTFSIHQIKYQKFVQISIENLL